MEISPNIIFISVHGDTIHYLLYIYSLDYLARHRILSLLKRWWVWKIPCCFTARVSTEKSCLNLSRTSDTVHKRLRECTMSYSEMQMADLALLCLSYTKCTSKTVKSIIVCEIYLHSCTLTQYSYWLIICHTGMGSWRLSAVVVGWECWPVFLWWHDIT